MTEIQQSLCLFDSIKGKLGESVGHKLDGGSIPGDHKSADSEEMGRLAPSASCTPRDTHGVGANNQCWGCTGSKICHSLPSEHLGPGTLRPGTDAMTAATTNAAVAQPARDEIESRRCGCELPDRGLAKIDLVV